eukprot:9440271-Pyramimonas_sp.AAC.1
MGRVLRARARLRERERPRGQTVSQHLYSRPFRGKLFATFLFASRRCLIYRLFHHLHGVDSLCVRFRLKWPKARSFDETRALAMLSVSGKWLSCCLAILLEAHVKTSAPR